MAYLGRHAPLDLWLVTQVKQADQVVLAADGPWSARTPVGAVMPWVDSFGLHMAAGTSPGTCDDVSTDPRYAAVASGHWSAVQGYTGVPLLCGDDELWGSISGYSDRAHDPRVGQASALVHLLGALLSALLAAETARRSADARARGLRRDLLTARGQADVDALTGLSNRRGWLTALAREDARASRSHTPSGVIALDLDELKQVNDRLGHAGGDELLRVTARVLTRTCRRTDVIARAGGDEFTVLAVDLAPPDIEALAVRLEDELSRSGVAASVGVAVRRADEGLSDTWDRADSTMYTAKRRRSR
ncbi:GGDEF domain-containing protein [Jannaschia sp. R86511]|uniref:GGDEF domain-containing protein n=1 Tax=Jannaschia sp. R86511 TaxID=3093853 RepID=UPI0036D3C145